MSRLVVFTAAVAMMALQPLLIHLAAENDRQRLQADAFILTVEALKFVLCATILTGRWFMGYKATVWCSLSHTAAFAVPAAIYLVMNIIKVVAARNLAPPIFQLLAASKIFCTAIASYLLLSKDLSIMQWGALAILTIGVLLGQKWDGAVEADVPVAPVFMMFGNSVLSAFAAVYTERVLKAHGSAALTIFATNLHMSGHTLLVNSAKVVVWEAPDFISFGSLGWWSWAALGNEAVNGILISAIMRHADSIVKNYAFSSSIFATAALSVPTLGYWPDPHFFVGAVLVVVSMALYTNGGDAQALKTNGANGLKTNGANGLKTNGANGSKKD